VLSSPYKCSFLEELEEFFVFTPLFLPETEHFFTIYVSTIQIKSSPYPWIWVKYIGITNDLERREEQHRKDGKRFSHLQKIGSAVNKETAEKWEEQKLKEYRWNHKGKNPSYNKTKK